MPPDATVIEPTEPEPPSVPVPETVVTLVEMLPFTTSLPAVTLVVPV